MEKLYADGHYKGNLVQTEEELKKVVAKILRRSRFAYDTEATSKLWLEATLTGISLSLGKRKTTWYVPVGHLVEYDKPLVQVRIDRAIELLRPIFESNELEIDGHNKKYDDNLLSKYGIRNFRKKRHIMNWKNFDTMVAMWLIDENTPNGLKYACKYYDIISDMKEFNEIVATVPTHVKKQHGFKGNQKATIDLVDVRIAGAYACDDAYGTYHLRDKVIPELKSEEMYERFYQIEMPYQRVLYLKEQRGFKIDQKKLRKMSAKAKERLEEIEYQIYEAVGRNFNINSGDQLADVLFNVLGFPILKMTKGGKKSPSKPSTDSEVFNALLEKHYKSKRMKKAQEVLLLIDDWRTLSKHRGTFMEGILKLCDKNGYVHTQFKQHGTVTGRLSSSDPNLQNQPNKRELEEGKRPDIRVEFDIRSCFIADTERDTVLDADYSNLELRILTHFSEEPSFIEAFLLGQDIHSRTAKEQFKLEMAVEDIAEHAKAERKKGKVCNFAIPYGTTAPTLKKSLPKGTTDAEAQEVIDAYFSGLPFIARHIKAVKKLLHKQGYSETILGKKRRVHKDINDHRQWVREKAERMGFNAEIQGTAADIIKVAQIKLEKDKFLEIIGFTQRLQVHDELLFVGPEKYAKFASAHIKNIMEHPFGYGPDDNLIIPLVTDPGLGPDWSVAKH